MGRGKSAKKGTASWLVIIQGVNRGVCGSVADILLSLCCSWRHCTPKKRLDIKPKLDDIVGLHNIVFAFGAHLAGGFSSLFAASCY